MKRSKALTAAVPSPGTDPGLGGRVPHRDVHASAACASTRESDVCPIPRLGELATRVKEITSYGLARTVR